MQNPVRRPSLVWPLVLIGLGTVWLLQNVGILPAGAWLALAQLWPVLLIVLGLDMLIGRRSTLGAVTVVIVGALVVAGALTWASVQANRLPAGGAQAIGALLRGAEQVTVKLNFDVGHLSVKALGPSDNLMEGQVVKGPGETVDQSYTVTAGSGELQLTQKRPPLFTPFLMGQTSQSQWEVQLSAKIPLTLAVQTGVGEAELDLAGLNLHALNLDTGVGQTTVAFPATGRVTANIKGGIGGLTLILPAEMPTRIQVQTGISNVQMPSRFIRNGEAYATAGFSATGDYLDINVTAGIGQVVVK